MRVYVCREESTLTSTLVFSKVKSPKKCEQVSYSLPPESCAFVSYPPLRERQDMSTYLSPPQNLDYIGTYVIIHKLFLKIRIA